MFEWRSVRAVTRTSAGVVVLIATLAGAAGAQSTAGTVAGRVVDARGLALEDATVTLLGPRGSKAFVSGSDGRFHAPFVAPGTYVVRAELQGFSAVEVRNVVVRTGRTTEVRISLEAGTLSSTIEPPGRPAAIDRTSTATGVVLQNELLERLPVGRRATGSFALVPGVPAYRGLDAVFVDGAHAATLMPVDFVEELDVKTGGYDAEFGQSVRALANIVTKSGGNQAHGSLFGYVQTSELEQDDLGAEAGGRLVINRLFYFGAIDQSWIASEGAASYAAKITGQREPTQSLAVSAFGDRANGDQGGHTQAIRYAGAFGANLLVEASYAHGAADQYRTNATYVAGSHELRTGVVLEDTESDPILFVQDRWRAQDRLAIAIGLRYETDWAPRTGAAFDVHGDARSRLYAQWGRFAGPLPYGLRTSSPAVKFETVVGYDVELARRTAVGGRYVRSTRPAAAEDAVEITVDRGFLDRWALLGTYRWSKRSSIDPGHQMKLFATYRWNRGLSVGVGARRTTFESEVDVRAAFTARVAGRRVTTIVDSVNLLNARALHDRGLRVGMRCQW